MHLAIKLNNTASNDPCALCGRRTDPETGPELFMADSWALVCYECGKKHAPALTECLQAYRHHLAMLESPKYAERYKELMGEAIAEAIGALVADRFAMWEEHAPGVPPDARLEPEHEEPFGGCPECGHGGEYRNIYKQHFFFCDEHRIVWSAGYNLFSSWRYEEEADWAAAWEKLKDYRVYDPSPLGPLQEVTSLEHLVPPPGPPADDGEIPF